MSPLTHPSPPLFFSNVGHGACIRKTNSLHCYRKVICSTSLHFSHTDTHTQPVIALPLMFIFSFLHLKAGWWLNRALRRPKFCRGVFGMCVGSTCDHYISCSSSSYAAFVLMRKLSTPVRVVSSFIPLFLRDGKRLVDWKRCAEMHGIGRIKIRKVMERANRSTVYWARRTLCECDRRIVCVCAVWSGLVCLILFTNPIYDNSTYECYISLHIS